MRLFASLHALNLALTRFIEKQAEYGMYLIILNIYIYR